VVVLAGELVVFGAVPPEYDEICLLDCIAEDDAEDELKAARPRSLMKLSICYRHARDNHNMTNKYTS